MFATAAAMVLWDQGLLDLDEPLTTYIPEFKMQDERYKQITPRMLMNHSSGLYGTTGRNGFLFDDPDPQVHDEVLPNLASQRLKADPGEFSVYCNDGFTLLEILVERISGMSFSEFLAEHFARPLGLANTKTPCDDLDRKERVVKNTVPFYAGSTPTETLMLLGSGGLYSTAEDLCRFGRVLMGKHPEILSEEAALLMRNEEYKRGWWVEAEGGRYIGGYGLGWDNVHCYPFYEYGLQALAKGGDTQLFHSSLVVIPELDLAMAVASSGGRSYFDYAFAASILQEYLLQKGAIAELLPSRPIVPPVKAAMPTELGAFSGLYVSIADTHWVTVEDGVLTISPLDGQPEAQWVYVGEEGFKNESGDTALTFTVQGDDRTYIKSSRLISIPGVGQVPHVDLQYQRVEPVPLAEEVLAAWQARAGKAYLVVTEKATSQAYCSLTSLNRN